MQTRGPIAVALGRGVGKEKDLMMWKRFVVGGALMLAAVAVTSPARAETYIRLNIGNAPPAPRVVFYQEPRYVVVPGTRVYTVRNYSGDYTMYRYGSSYYMTNDGYWYRSGSPRGRFVVVDRVPRTVYVAFGGGTSDRYYDDDDRYDNRYDNDRYYSDRSYEDDYRYAPRAPRVYFSDEPRFYMIPETRVYWVQNMSPGSYDLYRYGGNYYMYNDGYWYRSTALRGSYRVVSTRIVPRPVMVSIDYRSHSGRHDRGLHRGWRNRGG
jgi:hypothetical protein